MKLPSFEYFGATTIEEACSLLHKLKGNGKILGGGTALVNYLRHRVVVPRAVISISRIRELDYVRYEETTGLTIGACASIESLVRNPTVAEKYPGLYSAAKGIGVPAVRNIGTVGGNLCLDTRCIYFNQSRFWREAHMPCFKRGGSLCHAHPSNKGCQAVYQGDLAPVLMALGAQARIASLGGQRVVEFSDFFSGEGKIPNRLRFDEILIEIKLPSTGCDQKSAYRKLRIREAIDFPLAGIGVAIKTEGQRQFVKSVRIFAGALGPAPVELIRTEEVLIEKSVDEEVLQEAVEQAYLEIEPGKTVVDNLCMPMYYRRRMIKVLLRRAIEDALSLRPSKDAA